MGYESLHCRVQGEPNADGGSSQVTEQERGSRETARCEWDFDLATVVSTTSTARAAACDTLGAVELDPSGSLLATGGIARKIRFYHLNSLLHHRGSSNNHGVAFLDHDRVCDSRLYTPAKISSLRWKPGSEHRIVGSGDYDGVVMEYDVERPVPVFERDEHGGRRVWSIDYSQWDPVIGASASDDGTLQIWDPRCDGGNSLGAVQPSARRSPVCCAEFNPFGGPFVAAGCADRKAYCYDVRRMVDPLFVFDGHQKPCTYVRFLDHHHMVTSGTDGCLKMWRTEDQRLVRTYRGHVNSRRFVGLSVWRNGGLLGCGSESNQLFVYDKRWSEPIWVRGFEPMGEARQEFGFVSCLCWKQMGEDQCSLVAGDSDGVLRVFEVKRRLSSQNELFFTVN